MKRLVLAALLLVLTTLPARAGFDEGRAAYDRKNWPEAVVNLRPLAEAGDDRAMILLGNMYLFGFGFTPDAGMAETLYLRAAAAGNADAMLALGALHVNGDLGDVSYNDAAQWFRESAEHGSQMGAFYYATLILRGNQSDTDDLKSDPYTAYKWFKIAALRKQDPALTDDAADMAAMVADNLLSPEETARADQEIAGWTPKSGH